MLIQETPHSRQKHREAAFILKNGKFFDKIKRAWAFWVQCNLSFSSQLFAGYKYDKQKNKSTRRFYGKKLQFNKSILNRLELCDIECQDAIKVIQSRDTENSFFYVDPPYFNANMGHYKGYTQSDFIRLLDALGKIKGKFLLSSYPSEVLDSYSKLHGWFTFSKTGKATAGITKLKKNKIETLTANYVI